MKIRCKKCGDIIEGDRRGTYISCSCESCSVDETEYYGRIIGNLEYIEIIEEFEKSETK